MIFFFSFDTATMTWEMMQPMKFARGYASVAELNGYIYVAGGMEPAFTNWLELHDPSKDEWIELHPMCNVRTGFALIPANGYLYAIGHANIIEKYDPRISEWEQVQLRRAKEYTRFIKN